MRVEKLHDFGSGDVEQRSQKREGWCESFLRGDASEAAQAAAAKQAMQHGFGLVIGVVSRHQPAATGFGSDFAAADS